MSPVAPPPPDSSEEPCQPVHELTLAALWLAGAGVVKLPANLAATGVLLANPADGGPFQVARSLSHAAGAGAMLAAGVWLARQRDVTRGRPRAALRLGVVGATVVLVSAVAQLFGWLFVDPAASGWLVESALSDAALLAPVAIALVLAAWCLLRRSREAPIGDDPREAIPLRGVAALAVLVAGVDRLITAGPTLIAGRAAFLQGIAVTSAILSILDLVCGLLLTLGGAELVWRLRTRRVVPGRLIGWIVFGATASAAVIATQTVMFLARIGTWSAISRASIALSSLDSAMVLALSAASMWLALRPAATSMAQT